jgi:hypothetical protein
MGAGASIDLSSGSAITDEYLAARVISSLPALEAVKGAVHDIIIENGSVSLADIGKELTKFENAERVVCKHFINALVGQKVLDSAVKVLQQMGITPSNTLFAQSVCPGLSRSPCYT